MDLLVDGTESQRIQNLSKYEILDSPPEPAFDELTALAADICEVPISLLTFLDGRREWFKSNVGLSVAELPRHCAFCNETISASDLVIVPDTTRDRRFASNPLVTGEPYIRFYAGYPLVSTEGYGLGALCVLDRTPHELTGRQQQMLRMLGHEATILLEGRRQLHEERHRNQQQAAELNRLHEHLIQEKSEHHKAEEDLSRRERQLADAQRLARLGSWEWDLKTGQITWSDELYRILGIRPGEIPPDYDNYLKRVHPEEREKTDALLKATIEAKGSFAYEKRIVRSDGAIRTLFSTAEVVLDENHQPARMVGCSQDITARKEMEKRLESSVSLLHSALESTADGILVVDLNGRLLGHNQRFLELWHLPNRLMDVYDDRLVLAMVLDQLVDPDAFLRKVEDLYHHPDQDSFDTLEFRDGRIFERYSRPQVTGDAITGRVWSFRDVTERCRATEALRKSEERYRSLVIATSQVVWTTNAAGDAVEDSPSWRKFTGQTYKEMIGKGWMNAVHPGDRDHIAQIWPHAVAAESVYETEYRIRCADGHWCDVMVRGVPIRDESGKVREWVGFCIDITERKRAEQAVAAERDFSNAIINSLPGVFYLLDENGRILRWNKNMEIVGEYSASEIARMQASDFVTENDKSLMMERIGKVLSTGEADLEIVLHTKRGRPIPFYCTGRLVHIEGKPRVVGMGIDITKRKKAEQEIKNLNQQLEARVEERTRQLHSMNSELRAFSYSVSHDLKAPLRAIAGFAEAIMDDCSRVLDEEHRIYLERIRTAADRMIQLIEDLLTFSRLGQTAIQLRPVSLDHLVADVAMDFRFQLDALGAKLSIAPGLPIVNADQSLLSQVFTNLIENAITYRKKHIPLQISISGRSENDQVVVCVTDNGIGIASTHHERIFELFQRLHTVEEYPGTGIGLANVRKAVEMQGGRIWVESEVDKGSTFCIQLEKAINPEGVES